MNRKTRRQRASQRGGEQQAKHVAAAELDQALAQAVALHQAGRLRDAETLYRKVLAARPDYPEALHFFGVLAHQDGAQLEAMQRIQRAIEINPDEPSYHYHLGEVLRALGRPVQAAESYRKAIDINDGVSDAHFNLGVALAATGELEAAAASFRRAIELAPQDAEAHADLGDTLMRLGRLDDAEAAFARAIEIAPDFEIAAGRLSSLRHIRKHLPDAPRLDDRIELLRFAFGKAPAEGLVLEFGVAAGHSLRYLAGLTERTVYGFDSFEGLPEDWQEGFEKGAFSQAAPPRDLPENARVIVGWFEESLPPFVAEHPGPAAFIHVDSDLYVSAQTVFKHLGPRIVPGTVIVFDEYLNFPEWCAHEHKAFMEFAGTSGLDFEVIGATTIATQIAVRMTAATGNSQTDGSAAGS